MIRTGFVVEQSLEHWHRLIAQRTDYDLASIAVLQTALDDHDLSDQALGQLTRAVLKVRAAELATRAARFRTTAEPVVTP